MIEVWKPVVGYEGRYDVSDLGRVRSLDRVEEYLRQDQYSGRTLVIRRFHRGRLLRAGRTASGHLSVVLGRGQTKQVHVLVLEAFVGPCPEGLECCHHDDDPSNNRLGNLRWGTRSDNLNDAVRNGKKPIGEQHYFAKLKAADIPKIRRECQASRGSISRIARQYGVNETTIRQVRDGRAWRHIS